MSLTRTEIDNIRRKHQWSKRKTAKFLGIPESSYRLYEQGSLISKRSKTLDTKMKNLNELDPLTPKDIHRIRNMFGWSKVKMAAYLNISESTYRNYESGKRLLPFNLYPRIYQSNSALILFPERSNAFTEWYDRHTGAWYRKQAHQKYINQYHYGIEPNNED